MCTLAEVVLCKPLFHGDCELDQMHKIFQIMGTPNNKNWDQVESLPNYKQTFPKWKKTDLNLILKNQLNLLNPVSTTITSVIKNGLVMNPKERPDAKTLLILCQ